MTIKEHSVWHMPLFLGLACFEQNMTTLFMDEVVKVQTSSCFRILSMKSHRFHLALILFELSNKADLFRN